MDKCAPTQDVNHHVPSAAPSKGDTDHDGVPSSPSAKSTSKERRTSRRALARAAVSLGDTHGIAASTNASEDNGEVDSRDAKKSSHRIADNERVNGVKLNDDSVLPSNEDCAIERPGMNAKERRRARRTAERTIGAEPTGSIAKPEQESFGSVSARGTKTPSDTTTAPDTSNLDPSKMKGSTAKERRVARRQAAREVTAAKGTNESCTPDLETAVAPEAASNAKERRRLRREAERQKREREPVGVSNDTPESSTKRRKKSGVEKEGGSGRGTPHIVFVGQLAFSTTVESLEEYIRNRGGIEGKVSVRLLTHKGTNPPRSKGMAFVEVEDAENAYRCLSLHHTRLDGRLLNVERTSGGGKGKKSERIRDKRQEQKDFMKSVVQRVLAEFVEAGKLEADELDDAAKAVLEKMEAKVMERAVKDYCDKPDRLELENPSAWFTHHAHELAFRSDPETLEEGARDWLEKERAKADEKTGKGAKGKRNEPDRFAGPRGRGRGAPGFGGRGRGGRLEGGNRTGRGGRGGRGGPGGGGRSIDDDEGQDEGERRHVLAEKNERGMGLKIKPAVVVAAGGAGRECSNLVSIFPSLRGRGGGRVGVAAGRGRGEGGGGRGRGEGGGGRG